MLIATLKLVFRKPGYILLSASSAVTVLVLAAWLPNWQLIFDVIGNRIFEVVDKIKILVSLIGAIESNSTTLGTISIILIAILFGINISLFIFYFKRRIKLEKVAGMGGVGLGGGG